MENLKPFISRASSSLKIVFVVVIILMIFQVVNIFISTQYLIREVKRSCDAALVSMVNDHYKNTYFLARASWAKSSSEDFKTYFQNSKLDYELKKRLSLVGSNDNLTSSSDGKILYHLKIKSLKYDNDKHLNLSAIVNLKIPIYFFNHQISIIDLDLNSRAAYQLKGTERSIDEKIPSLDTQ